MRKRTIRPKEMAKEALSGTFWDRTHMLAKLTCPLRLTFVDNSLPPYWGAFLLPKMQLLRAPGCDNGRHRQDGWCRGLNNLSPALPRLPLAPRLLPVVAPRPAGEAPAAGPQASASDLWRTGLGPISRASRPVRTCEDTGRASSVSIQLSAAT